MRRQYCLVAALAAVLFAIPVFGQDGNGGPFKPNAGDSAPVASHTHTHVTECTPSCPLYKADNQGGFRENPRPYPALSKGDFGPAVFNLQKMLVMLDNSDFYPGVPDGDFGPRTEHAICKFQQYVGHSKCDGRMDAETWRKLIERVDAIEDERPEPIFEPDEDSTAPDMEDLSPYEAPEDVKALSERIASFLVGRRESDAEALISLINELLKNTGSKLTIQMFVASNDNEDFSCTADYRVDRILVDIRRGIISKANVH